MELNSDCPDLDDNRLCGLSVARHAIAECQAFVMRGNRILAFDVPLEDGVRFREALEGGGDPVPETPYGRRITYLGCMSCGHYVVASIEQGRQQVRRSTEALYRSEAEA